MRPHFRDFLSLSAFAALVLGPWLMAANAGQVASRADLNTILGASGVTDDFESFSVGSGSAANLDVNSIDSTTVTNGQGPGLVHSGVTYSSGALQWNGNGYFGIPSQTISGNATNPDTITYSVPVSAIGVDLDAYSGHDYIATVNVYDRSNTLIDSIAIPVAAGSEPIFFGYQNAGGIGHVDLFDTTDPFGPIIDNSTFGVPEPASLGVLGIVGISLLGRRRA